MRNQPASLFGRWRQRLVAVVPVGVEPVSAIVEPVSGSLKRKLEKPEQRLARQPRQLGALSASFPGQRLWRICLSLGNIVSSRKPGELRRRDALAGWGARIRTWEWRNQNPLGNPYFPALISKNSSETVHQISIG